MTAAALAAALTACGGGGGGGGGDVPPPVPPPPPPSGVVSPVNGAWSGSAGSDTARVFVTENDTMMTFLSDANGVPLRLFTGAMPASNGAVSGPDLDSFTFATIGASPASATGSYVAGTSMNLTLTPTTGTPVSLALGSNSADYDPSRAANLATDLVGVWQGAFRPGEVGTVSIDAAGIVRTIPVHATTGAVLCTTEGTAVPSTTENVFAVSLDAGVNCAASGATGTGLMFVVGTGSSARLYMAVTTSDGGQGAVFIGRRLGT